MLSNFQVLLVNLITIQWPHDIGLYYYEET